FADLGYHSVFSGQPAYNGVALLSTKTPSDVETQLRDFEDAQRRVLCATVDGVRIVNVYVPNGQRVDSDKYEYKLQWLDALRAHLAKELAGHPRLMVLGDFNIAPEDRDVHDPAAWEGKVHVSPAEREALRNIRELGLIDVFRLFEQPERAYSWWDYRAGAFRRNLGLRIDLILASAELSERCIACHIDPRSRGWSRPSDHAPVVAQFSIS